MGRRNEIQSENRSDTNQKGDGLSRLPIIIIQISVLVFSHLKHVTCGTRGDWAVKSQQVATVTFDQGQSEVEYKHL
jgi:hypothetical protein